MSNTLIVTSGKGGTGKSMVACNLGLSLSYLGKKTVMIDMNPEMRALDLYLGVENRAIFDVDDIMKGRCSFDTAIIYPENMHGLAVIPSPPARSAKDWTEESLEEVLKVACGRFDFVILDCPPGSCGITDVCAQCADVALFVTTPDHVSVRSLEALEDRFIRMGISRRRLIINSIEPHMIEKKTEPDIESICSRFRCELLGNVMYDTNIRASMGIGMPVVAKRDSYIAANFDKMARELIKEAEEI